MGTSTPNMSDRRLVEAGRLCLVNYGPLTGKLCIIVNVVSSKMVLVDGPTTGVSRHLMPIKRLSITNIKCDIMPGAKVTALKKAIEAAGVAKKWGESSWAKGMAKKSAMGDFDRFTLMVARKTRARAVNKALKGMKKK